MVVTYLESTLWSRASLSASRRASYTWSKSSSSSSATKAFYSTSHYQWYFYTRIISGTVSIIYRRSFGEKEEVVNILSLCVCIEDIYHPIGTCSWSSTNKGYWSLSISGHRMKRDIQKFSRSSSKSRSLLKSISSSQTRDISTSSSISSGISVHKKWVLLYFVNHFIAKKEIKFTYVSNIHERIFFRF